MEEGVGRAIKAHEGAKLPEESSSSFLLALKLRTATASSHKAGPRTPSASWPSAPPPADDIPARDQPHLRNVGSCPSARQLGASVWEIRGMQRRRRRVSGGDGDVACEGAVDRPQSSCGLNKCLAAPSIQHHELREPTSQALPVLLESPISSIGAMSTQKNTPCRLASKLKPKEAGGSSLKTSTELLKVLNRIWKLEEQHAASSSLIKSLKSELQQAQAHIQELLREKMGYSAEMDALAKHISDDMFAKKSSIREKAEAALQTVQDELDNERLLRRQSESLHRKLGKELSELKKAFLKAVQELEKERKTNSLLEDLCDEFAKGVRSYEEEVRGLKQRNATDHDHKFDRLVLHIAESWLDERIQIEMAISRGDMAEKSAIMERLSGEIMTFLEARQTCRPREEAGTVAALRRQSLESVYINGTTSAPRLPDEDDDGDSADSNMHCFELSMSKDCNRCLEKLKGHQLNNKYRSDALTIAAKTITEAPGHHNLDMASTSKLYLDRDFEDRRRPPDSKLVPAGSSRIKLCDDSATPGDSIRLLGLSRAECSPDLPPGVDSTLKAKLLQARLEGRHARLTASGSSSISRARKMSSQAPPSRHS